jgi:amino acid adenylation domain-containing protein
LEPKCELLHEWLLAAAQQTPEAIAIDEDGRETCFAEVVCRAKHLACLFLKNGLMPRDRVALVLPKTTEAVIAVFATLMAGGIYVPIHPRWPKARIQAVIDDCSPRFVLEEAAPLPSIVALPEKTVLAWPENSGAITDETFPPVNSSATAILLFTSGSTGNPKGVMLSHRAVAAFVSWTADEFALTSSDRIASPAPLGFDLSTFDLFGMAFTGGTAVLIPENIGWMPRFLAKHISRQRISAWYSVPSTLASLVDDGHLTGELCPELRLILFAGEAFPPPTLARVLNAIPMPRYANLYGPTETNVVTWHAVPRDYDGRTPLPIGLPCPYALTTIDPENSELLAAGRSCMDGYWSRAEETERAFTKIGNELYYRTGDRVSIGDDGAYLFHGRLDRQVKRRGFRIELGEIENCLLRHPDVLEAAVVAVNRANQTVLCAFVRTRAEGVLTLAAVRAHCSTCLPPYAIPDRIEFPDMIKKGNRGKVDYLALKIIAEGLIRED